MTADDLYDAIKTALSTFGLRWGDKDKIEVSFSEGKVHFIHENRMLTVED